MLEDFFVNRVATKKKTEERQKINWKICIKIHVLARRAYMQICLCLIENVTRIGKHYVDIEQQPFACKLYERSAYT